MKIGLTGSIACGKSTVSQYLRQKGCFIVDADAISRALTADGGAALPEIRRAFGDDVFSGASLDRAKLGQLVFADAQKRETLNAILHPMILSEIRRQLDRLDAPGQIVVGDIPLLFECGMASMFDTVWVVRAARETQIQRLFERVGDTFLDFLHPFFFVRSYLFEQQCDVSYLFAELLFQCGTFLFAEIYQMINRFKHRGVHYFPFLFR